MCSPNRLHVIHVLYEQGVVDHPHAWYADKLCKAPVAAEAQHIDW